MTDYFFRRLLLLVPTFLGVTLLVFALTRLVPGGPIEQMMNAAALSASETGGGGGNRASGQTLSAEQLEELKAYYGFDKPILVSYADWLGKVVTLDLGVSTRFYEPVWDSIAERLPISAFHGLIALLLTYGVCVPLGISKALRHRSTFDDLSSVLVFVGYAVPAYVVAIGLLVVFAFDLGWFPLRGFVSDDFETMSTGQQVLDVLHHAVLPIVAYVAGSFAVTTLLLKNTLLDQLSADYVRTAVAKGLGFRQAVFGHALRNSLIPIATSFGQNVAGIVGGSFLVEKVFNIDGFGLLGYESLLQRDYPVVMGILVITALLYLLGNILSDICVALVDPRVKFGDAR